MKRLEQIAGIRPIDSMDDIDRTRVLDRTGELEISDDERYGEGKNERPSSVGAESSYTEFMQ